MSEIVEKRLNDYQVEAAEGAFGPAMVALPTDRQRAFVIALLDTGGINHTKAAQLAGYEGGTDSLRVTAHRVFHDERVQAAIREEANRRLHAASGLAVCVLVEIASSSPQPKDRIKAAQAILNRTGMHEKTEHKVTTTDISKTDEELVKRAKELAKQFGMDESQLLGDMGIVDAEYTEVPAGPALPAPDETWSAE